MTLQSSDSEAPSISNTSVSSLTSDIKTENKQFALSESPSVAMRELNTCVRLMPNRKFNFVDMWFVLPTFQETYGLPLSNKILRRFQNINVPLKVLSGDKLILTRHVVVLRFHYSKEYGRDYNVVGRIQQSWYPSICGKVPKIVSKVPKKDSGPYRNPSEIKQVCQVIENLMVKLNCRVVCRFTSTQGSEDDPTLTLPNEHQESEMLQVLVKRWCGVNDVDYTYTNQTQQFLLEKEHRKNFGVSGEINRMRGDEQIIENAKHNHSIDSNSSHHNNDSVSDTDHKISDLRILQQRRRHQQSNTTSDIIHPIPSLDNLDITSRRRKSTTTTKDENHVESDIQSIVDTRIQHYLGSMVLPRNLNATNSLLDSMSNPSSNNTSISDNAVEDLIERKLSGAIDRILQHKYAVSTRPPSVNVQSEHILESESRDLRKYLLHQYLPHVEKATEHFYLLPDNIKTHVDGVVYRIQDTLIQCHTNLTSDQLSTFFSLYQDQTHPNKCTQMCRDNLDLFQLNALLDQWRSLEICLDCILTTVIE